MILVINVWGKNSITEKRYTFAVDVLEYFRISDEI
jgi:hypothetical protein